MRKMFNHHRTFFAGGMIASMGRVLTALRRAIGLWVFRSRTACLDWFWLSVFSLEDFSEQSFNHGSIIT
jgi:hypothetical protein